MLKGVTITLLLFCFLGVSFGILETFSPIHPGSIHVDEFSPLDNDRVNVPDFTVVDFGAAVLDFKSLKSATPVVVDIAGGINVQGEEVQFFSSGDIGVISEVNDLPINAVQGQVLFQSQHGGIDTVAYIGEIGIDSGNGNINVNSAGALSFDAASFLLNGRQNSHGLSLTTENKGDMHIGAGQTSNVITSQVNVAGYDVTFDLLSSTSFLSHEGDILLTAGDGLEISSGTVSIASNQGVTTTSDVSNILMEADGAYTLNSNVVEILTSNGQAYSSVTGNIGIEASQTSFYHALDTVEVNSVNNGIFLNSLDNIEATAGNNVFFNSDGEFEVTSTDFVINSQKDKFIIDTDGDTTISASSSVKFSTYLDSHITASDTLGIQARGVTFAVEVDATLNSDDKITVQSSTDASFNGNEIHIDTLNDYKYNGRSVDIVADDEIHFESGLNIDMNSGSEDTKFSYGGDGYVIGASSLTFQSDLLTTISANTIDATAGGDINVSAVDISYDIDASLTENSKNGFYIAGFASFNSETTEFQAQSIDARAEAGIDVDAAGYVNFIAENNLRHVADTYTADTSLYTIGCFYDFFTTTDEKVIFQNDAKAPSLTTVAANSDITISSGYSFLSGDSLSIYTAYEAYFFARDSFSLTSSNILFTKASSVAIKSDGVFDFYAGDLTLSSTSAYFTANDAYSGDISFTSTSSGFTLNTENFVGASSLAAFIASSDITFNVAKDFTLTNIEQGDIEFYAGDQFIHSVLSTGLTHFSTSNYTVAGDESVSISSTGPDGFKITTGLKDSVSFNSGGDLNVTTNGDLQFSSNHISFHAVESGSIQATTYTLASTNTIAFTSDDYINIAGLTAVNDVVKGLTALDGSENVVITGGALNYNFGSGIINANGGGARFYSHDNTSFATSNSANSFSVEAYYLAAYNSQNGSISMTSANGQFSINGGASRYTTGENSTIEISSTNEIEIRSQNNGNVTFYSDNHFIVNAKTDISFTGVDGRDSLITSTQANTSVVIKSDFIGDTTFNAGGSMEVQAFGDDGILQAFADNTVAISSNEYSLNILSEGWQTDPQFTLNKTFGILLRTTHENDAQSGISIQSNTESVSVFARGIFNASSLLGSIDQNAGSRIDIRSRFYDADILVQTFHGDINVQTLDGYFVSGTPSIRADTMVNATGHQEWSADSGRIQQFSTIQDPSDSAIIFEGYHGDITINSPTAGSHTFHANDGGKIGVVARNGDINYTTGDFIAAANTGAIELEGRTSASFTAGTTIVIDAEGTGGSILVATPGGNDVVINAASFIEMASTIGELDFIATTGITTLSQRETVLRGPCVHLYGGGSLEIDATNDITIHSTDNSIAMDAEIEVTVDAARFTVKGPLIDPLVRVRAGGDSTTDGLDITSKGDILFTTQNDVELNSVFSQINSNSNINFASTSLNITSFGDSTAQTNVVIQAENGDIDVTTPFFIEHSLTQSQVTSQGLLHFTATNDINIAALREVRYVSLSMDVDVSGFIGVATNQVNIATDGDIKITAANEFDTSSDSIMVLNSGNDLIASATDDLTFTSAYGALDFQAANDLTFGGSFTDFTSVSQSQTQLDGYNGITMTPTVGSKITAQNDIVLTSRNDITYSNIDKLTMEADTFQSTSGSELSITAASAAFTAYNFVLDAADDITVSAGAAIDINGATGLLGNSAPVTYTSGNDITLTSPTQSYTADNNVYLTSEAGIDNYNKYGIDIKLAALSFVAPATDGVFSVDSRGYTQIQNTDTTGDVTLNGVVAYFLSSGQSGVQLKGDTLTQTSSFNIDVIADSGNIFLQGATTLQATGGDIVFHTHNTDGNIRLIADNDASFTSTSQFIQPLTDPGVEKGFGNITFIADAITAGSQNFDFYTHHDFLATSVGALSISASAAVVNINANRKVEFGGSNTYFKANTAASGAISVTTAGDYSDFLIETSNLQFTVGTSATTNFYTDTSSGPINILSGGNLVEQSPTAIRYNSGDSILFLADSSFISVEFTNIQYTATKNFEVNADTDRISAAYDTYTLSTNYMSNFAKGEAYIGSVNSVTGATVSFESARNFEAIANTVTATAANAVFIYTAGDGDIRVNSANLISMTTTDMTWEAHGNLAALGGAYVLEDDFNNPTKSPFNAYRPYFQSLINENTDAIEAVAVAGSVSLTGDTGVSFTSNKGNINFKAIRHVRYVADVTNGRISFFNVASRPDIRPNYGQRRVFPVVRQADYCFNGNSGFWINCGGLSNMINKMVDTMVWYGLLSPGNGFGPLTPPNNP